MAFISYSVIAISLALKGVATEVYEKTYRLFCQAHVVKELCTMCWYDLIT